MRPSNGKTEGRTPQACDSCRRSKTKCTGRRPECHACRKRKVICSWPKALTPGNYYLFEASEIDSVPGIQNTRKPVSGICASASINSVLPGDLLLQRLLKIFLVRHHDVELCSFLHKPSIDLYALSVRSPLLVTSILSLSALYISENEARREFGFESAAALSKHYAQFARNFAKCLFDEPSVYTIQAYLVLAIRELVTWSNFKAWMYAGTAIRMAQALRLGLEFNQRHSPQQKEIRRRTFWACFVVDRLISFSCNEPFAIDMLSVRVQLPCPENTFLFEEVYFGPSLDSINLHTDQLSQLGVAPFYIKMVQLWGNMAVLHMSGGRRRLNYAPTDPAGEFYQNDKAIEEFASSLPPRLHWSVRNYKLHQVTGQAQAFVNLNFLLQHSRCILHQEYLPQLDSQYGLNLEIDEATSYDSAGLSLDHIDVTIIDPCVAAVHAITDMAVTLNTGSTQDQAMLQSTFAANALMTASAVHLWIKYTQTCDKCPKHVAKANFDKLLQIIRSWQPRWRVAFAWVETLEVLYKLYEFSYGTAIVSDLNCWETGTDEITQSPELIEEVIDENGGHVGLSDGDGISDPATICQRLHDKVRSILLNPLHPTDVKKRNLRIYCRTLWQHMWIHGPLGEAGDDFMNLADSMGSATTFSS